MSDHREEIGANRRVWDSWTGLHRDAGFYDVPGFRAGKTSLREIELDELGSRVSGRSLLHLQCHFGMDTLSWARKGARVTGVDFAPRAIEAARELAVETGLDARFLCSDVYALPEALPEQFDIVFTSYGVLWWLPDLSTWGRIVAGLLKPGGTFYIVEFHPLLSSLDDDGALAFDYFNRGAAVRDEKSVSYVDPAGEESGTSYGWPHSLAEIVTALVDAGLTIESLREFDYSPYDCFPFTERIAPDRYALRGRPSTIPLTFSLTARR